MSSQSSSSPPPKPQSVKLPTYITDPLRDPDLLSDNWFALAELETQRQQAGRESLVRTRYAKPPEVARYSIANSVSPENKNRNRYQNVAPYDLNAVRVGEEELGEGQGMYVNASWVRERAGGALWIASQVSRQRSAGMCGEGSDNLVGSATKYPIRVSGAVYGHYSCTEAGADDCPAYALGGKEVPSRSPVLSQRTRRQYCHQPASSASS